MFRQALTAIAIASISSGAIANAQSKYAPSTTIARSADPVQTPECIAIGYIRDKIIVGRGREKFEIDLDGGACEASPSGISGLTVHIAMDDVGGDDAIEAESCPAYETQINKLWSARQHSAWSRGFSRRGIRTGPFVIFNGNNLFELKSAHGRKEAMQWVYETLAALRPCWNNFRDDHTRHVVDRLYAALAMKPH